MFRSPLRVDRDAGVIHGVKVLGWNSSNKRRYQKEAVERAVRRGLYEGVRVYIDHQKPGDTTPRSSRDFIGVLRGAKVGEDGVHADLHYNRKSHFVEEVLEDVERGLGGYGLSHEAEAGDCEYRDGVQVITEIAEVTAVALVANPATTKNLWEGTAVAKTTLRAYLESRTLDPKLDVAARKRLLEMCSKMGEDDGTGGGDLMMDEPPAEDAGGTDGRSLLHQAIAALAASGDPDDHELATKVLKLVKPEGAPDGLSAEEDAMDGMGDDEDEDNPMKSEGKTPKARPEVALTEESARDLCGSIGAKPSDALIETITGLTLSKALKVLREVQAVAGTQRTVSAPRSQEPRRQSVVEGNGGGKGLKLPGSPQDLRQWARNN